MEPFFFYHFLTRNCTTRVMHNLIVL
ncbi:DUF4105 domain-containing protein [Clostridioides difficile]|nr:DUF4105 domain-containing protein [Clostridioides difficile]